MADIFKENVDILWVGEFDLANGRSESLGETFPYSE